MDEALVKERKLLLSVGLALGLVAVSLATPLGPFTSSRIARAASASASPSADVAEYTVEPGDTLSAIAYSFGVEARAIQDLNGIEDPDSIRVGAVIAIPTKPRYTVKPGDTLTGIAMSYGIRARAIEDANDIEDPNGIMAGQVLTIPDRSQSASTANPAPSTSSAPVSTAYVVESGDTLTAIAAARGVSVQAIKDANDIQDPNHIKVGQTLSIPSASAAASARGGLVVLDPGHGGAEIGAASEFPGLPLLAEKDLNLKVALRTAELLRQGGRQVRLTRTTDSHVNNSMKDVTGDGSVNLADDLEARVDIANNSGARLFLSIHFNGSVDQGLNGATVYYDNARPFSDKNHRFAQLVLDNLVATTRAAGYDLASSGVMTDESAVGMDNHFYVLGPVGDVAPRATQMVGALAEGAFITNSHDAALLAQDEFLEAVAQGYARAIQQWFQSAGT